MKILVLTSLFPPLHAGTYDFRCEQTCRGLSQRGHEVRVLTSTHGLQTEQRGPDVERRLWLNGAFGHDAVTDYGPLERIELHNHAVLRGTLAEFQPALVYVWSLAGLSKSLLYTLHKAAVPHAFDVADDWLHAGLRADPWLRFWNSPAGNVRRAGLELAGVRNRLDATAPTRLTRGYDRMPEVYGDAAPPAAVAPGGVAGFRFERISFTSPWLKQQAEAAGFRVRHAAFIPPAVDTGAYFAEPRPESASCRRLLLAGPLSEEGGLETVLRALVRTREQDLRLELTVYGRGDSDLVARVRSEVVRRQLPVTFITPGDQSRDLPGVLRQHDALVYARETPEAWPRFLPEAMTAGLPAVSTEVGGAGALASHGHNALTFRVADDAHLATRLATLAADGPLRRRLALTAQEWVMQNLNESRLLDAAEQFLEGTLEAWAVR